MTLNGPASAAATGWHLLGRALVAELLAYLGLALLLFRTAWADPAHRLIGNGGDTPQFAWFLEWTALAVRDLQNPFHSALINYPAGVNLMWNTAMLPAGAVLAPITLNSGPVVAYNILLTASLAVSAWTAAMAIRRLVPDRAASAAGGLFFGFSPYMVGHAYGHPNLTLAVYPPLTLLAAHQLLVRRRHQGWVAPSWGLLTGLQLYLSEDLLATTVVAAAVSVVILLAQHPEARWMLRRAAPGMALGIAVACVVAGPGLAYQLAGPLAVTGLVHPRNIYVADLLNFIVPTGNEVSHLVPGLERVSARFSGGNGSEAVAYLGIPLLVVAAGTFVRFRREGPVRYAGLLALVMAILALGPRLHVAAIPTAVVMPFSPIGHLPFLDDLLPVRLVLFVDLAVAILLARAVLAARHARDTARVMGVIAGILVVYTLWPLSPFPSTPATTPPFFMRPPPALTDGTVVLVLPFSSEARTSAPMLWQAESGMRFKMPEGYFLGPRAGRDQNSGPDKSQLEDALLRVQSGRPVVLDTARRRALASDLADHQVQAIVVGPMPRQRAMLVFLTDLMGTAPRAEAGAWWWSSGRPSEDVARR